MKEILPLQQLRAKWLRDCRDSEVVVVGGYGHDSLVISSRSKQEDVSQERLTSTGCSGQD